MSERPDPCRVAFVIPARNEEAYIERAIASVQGQTLPAQHLELVVVENGSTDGTATVAQQAIDRTPSASRARVMRLESAGIAGAKNRGARAASAEVLIFLDADSRAAPDLAQRVVAWTERGFQAGSIRMVADSDKWVDRRFFELIDWGKGLFGIHANMMFCSRLLFLESGGFDESIKLAEDLDFLDRLKRSGVSLCHVNDSWIATSARRMHERPLAFPAMFTRWLLAQLGIGRRWRY